MSPFCKLGGEKGCLFPRKRNAFCLKIILRAFMQDPISCNPDVLCVQQRSCMKCGIAFSARKHFIVSMPH